MRILADPPGAPSGVMVIVLVMPGVIAEDTSSVILSPSFSPATWKCFPLTVIRRFFTPGVPLRMVTLLSDCGRSVNVSPAGLPVCRSVVVITGSQSVAPPVGVIARSMTVDVWPSTSFVATHSTGSRVPVGKASQATDALIAVTTLMVASPSTAFCSVTLSRVGSPGRRLMLHAVLVSQRPPTHRSGGQHCVPQQRSVAVQQFVVPLQLRQMGVAAGQHLFPPPTP